VAYRLSKTILRSSVRRFHFAAISWSVPNVTRDLSAS
jgi:hypothetical protein